LNQIRAVVVDDSAFMRKSLSIMLESDGSIKVIGTARDGEEGYKLVRNLRPDIVTLDIEMPRMDGLTALKNIMKDCPTSVIMISSITTEGADATLKALELGAVDFIPKGLSYVNVNIIKIKEDLILRVKEIVKQKTLKDRIGRLNRIKGNVPEVQISYPTECYLPVKNYKAIALGISTGGPMSLQRILPEISPHINCPVFIVQHMPPKFTKSLADRLDSICKLKIKEAENNEIINNNTVYIAPGGSHMTVNKRINGTFNIDISENPTDTIHKPSVDVMINSIAENYGKNIIGIIMTGMGKDGFIGIQKIKNQGGYCVAQNEESCVVYGMPKAIIDAGLADVISPLEKIPLIINKAFNV
jgi:two-component system chemotaxis response regulator CheB